MEGVSKYDSNGNLIWHTPIQEHNSYASNSIVINPIDGSAVATTRFGNPVAKLDTDGNILWQISGPERDDYAVKLDPDRNAAYIVGETNDNTWSDAYLYKRDLTTGNIIWELHRDCNSPGGMAVNPIDGSIYVGFNDHILWKVDPNGTIIWAKDIGYIPGRITIASTTGSIANGTLSGKVTESDRKTPISNALVTASQGTATIGTATTDVNGIYSMTLAQGTYTVVMVSRTQYLPTQTTDIVVRQGTTTRVNFTLYSARIKPTVSSPQSAGSEVLLRIQAGDANEPVNDLFTLSGTLTYTPADGIEILQVSPGEFMGSDLQVFEVDKSTPGKIRFIMRRKAGGVTGAGSVLDIKFKIADQAQSGAVTFTLDGIAAYNSNNQWVSLLPEANELKINRVPIKAVVYPPILPDQEFTVDIQVGDAENMVNGVKSVSLDLQCEGADIVEVVTPVSGNVKPGEFLGDSAVGLATLNNGRLSLCVGRVEGESSGYGTVAKVKYRVLHQVIPGTRGTFTITNVLAYGPDFNRIGLIPVECPFTIELPDTWTQVWPGDTDNSGGVDKWDIIPIAFYLWKTGQKREAVSMDWRAWPAAYWNILELPCPDAVYSDANGDGVVDITDVHAIIMNYGKTHPKTTALSAPRKTDDAWLNGYREVLKNRPDLLEKVKYVLAGLKAPEMQQESQEFIAVLEAIIEPLPAAEFKVYPNPYRPTGIHATLAGIKFTNLGTDWNIKIFNMAGELVEEMYGIGNDYDWTTAKDLASGVYVYIINSSTLSKKTGKLAIIR